jgi:hypothetical protein
MNWIRRRYFVSVTIIRHRHFVTRFRVKLNELNKYDLFQLFIVMCRKFSVW